MSEKELRFGQISYTNTLPVFYFFDQARFQERIDFIKQVPAQLNKGMAEGTIDIGPISSFGYAEHYQDYYMLSDLSVSAKHKVGSIYLFSKRPIEELDGTKIRLTNTSATSVNLLKIILKKFMKFTNDYEWHEPVLDKMLDGAEGALLIGDDAIAAYRNNTQYHVYDLATLWHKHTGHSMTFAVWAVRRDAVAKYPDLLRQVHEAFLDSKERSLANLEPLVKTVIEEHGGDATFWFEYFQGLCYDFNKEQQEGLEYYFACATELGLLPGPVEICKWEKKPSENTL